jgi:cyclopropane fatty-acyl-phospholipid synthase-like methyltransferase
MIDTKKVKSFWDARAAKYGSLDFNSIANLEEDPDNLKLKITLETEKVFSYLGPVAGKTILDLGAGVGQWVFRFVDRGASSVTAVEYSESLVEIGRREVALRGITNVEFVVSPAEDFKSENNFDVVFISGLFVYTNDEQAERIVEGLPKLCHPDTTILMRDGTGVPVRYTIDNRFSEHLQTYYSSTYRTAAMYKELFGRHGFRLLQHENMFDEGCPLNKYPETRLRIYRFSPTPVGLRDA